MASGITAGLLINAKSTAIPNSIVGNFHHGPKIDAGYPDECGDARRLSENSDRSEGESWLGRIFRSFEANSRSI